MAVVTSAPGERPGPESGEHVGRSAGERPGPASGEHVGRSAGERPDELPEDLDVTVARPYRVPDTARRRIGAATLLAVAAAALAGFAVSGHGGLAAVAVVLAALGAYQFACAWPLRLDETAALAAAARAVGFPVGHASAQLAWRGLRSRPTWRVLLYSADEPPTQRGLVELDGVDGEILGHYTEHNPEDWSAYTA